MNKLEEIKDNFKITAPWWFGVSREDMKYLFSLLEEKDKELQEIIETYDEGEQYLPTVRKMVRIARTALSTHKGE